MLMNQAQHQPTQPQLSTNPLAPTTFPFFGTTPAYNHPLEDYNEIKDDIAALGADIPFGSDEFDKYLKEFLNPEGTEDQDGLAAV
jgi:hypothetical protein